MLGRLILVFILVPLTDLILLMVLAQYISWPVTIAIVIVSGIIGAWLARRSSLAVIGKVRSHLSQGQLSSDLLTDGAMILFAAGLLLTPGFLTDAVGLSLLIPPCRRWYKARLSSWFKKHVQVQVFQGTNGSPWSRDDRTVDGQVVEEREFPDASSNDSTPDKLETRN